VEEPSKEALEVAERVLSLKELPWTNHMRVFHWRRAIRIAIAHAIDVAGKAGRKKLAEELFEMRVRNASRQELLDKLNQERS